MKHFTPKKLILSSLISTCILASQYTPAHSGLFVEEATEGEVVLNYISVGHGCENAKTPADNFTKPSVVANVMIFPDETGTIEIDGADAATTPADYLTTWPGRLIRNIPSKAVFDKQQVKYGSAVTKIVGIANYGGGGSIPGYNSNGLLPFKITAPSIKPSSCAKSVTFNVNVIDICKITGVRGFSRSTVNPWISLVGSKFDAFPTLDGLGEAGTFTVNRDTNINPLPITGCSPAGGNDITVTATGVQINRDATIKGVWPK